MMVCINPKKKYKQQKKFFGGQLVHKDEKGAVNVDENAAEKLRSFIENEKFKTKKIT